MNTERLADEECAGSYGSSGLTTGGGHCSGFPAVGNYQQGPFLLGGACRAAVYRSPFPPVGTCFDRKKNGDETGTDCGGSCPRCYGVVTSGGYQGCYQVRSSVRTA